MSVPFVSTLLKKIKLLYFVLEIGIPITSYVTATTKVRATDTRFCSKSKICKVARMF